MRELSRCEWCLGDPLYISYHDEDWGVPVHDDNKLFEMLTLEGAQAGLSWLTVLKKRENYIEAFNRFDLETIINYSEKDIERLLQNSGIIRNRLKIESVIKNAKGTVAIIEEFGSLSAYIWDIVDGKTVQNSWKALTDIPANTSESDKMSKDLKKRGFNFVGSTICYAYMQSIGLVNDHVADCFRYSELKSV